MSDILFQHIAKHINISSNDFAAMLPYFRLLNVKKKEDLVMEGKPCRQNYFVLKGSLRMFFLTENGGEQTIQFAIENWWMTDVDAFSKGKTASFTVQAMEHAEVISISKEDMDQLLAAYPFMERYFRMIYERAYAASLFRVKYIFQLSKEQFYNHFASQYPAFIQRIPQKILASFLGFTPEYLSELRKKQALGKK
ncbi:Crp/Fnr family transcriptional regulator [uncultured Chitinophaga sp.]|uniref:Crp/Fnr family transcriptional regulator n=1 Tax=uncultured Chitinophaga sp. TaxID=339340 RepID=UPI0025DE5854|nr:Crp/Fnr family transcriptional regulator [uncultured Chitinophaga sp.]